MHNSQASGREQAEAIWRAGVEAVQPHHCIPAEMAQLRETVGGWSPDREYVVVGGGKAGAAMAQATEGFLLQQGIPASQINGWVNIPEVDHSTPGSSSQERDPATTRIHLHPARPPGYNFPTAEAVTGTREILKLVDEAADDAVILCLISGGGSAILSAPTVSLEAKLLVSKQLSAAGATIGELNTVRKHLSQFKGGQLTAHCFRNHPHRRLVSLIISDVIGDPLDVIASGPTAVDPTTFADALRVLKEKHVMLDKLSEVVAYLEAGVQGEMPETLKAYPANGEHILHRLVASNQKAISAAAEVAEKLGYQVIEYADRREHDTTVLAGYFADQIASMDPSVPTCLISGGETTVKLPAGHGKGGRNQSFALGLLVHLKALLRDDHERWNRLTMLCAGTDGEDGPTDAAGAFADLGVLQAATRLGLSPEEHLMRHDAYPFFAATGGLLKTGLTQTNVMDLRVFLI